MPLDNEIDDVGRGRLVSDARVPYANTGDVTKVVGNLRAII